MKKITILSFLIGSLVFGQDFFSSGSNQSDEELQQSSFSDQTEYSQPDQGLDEAGGPGDPPGVPINNWIFLLPLAGIAIGAFYLSRRKTEAL